MNQSNHGNSCAITAEVLVLKKRAGVLESSAPVGRLKGPAKDLVTIARVAQRVDVTTGHLRKGTYHNPKQLSNVSTRPTPRQDMTNG